MRNNFLPHFLAEEVALIEPDTNITTKIVQKYFVGILNPKFSISWSLDVPDDF
jgi:hypothetical protein